MKSGGPFLSLLIWNKKILFILWIEFLYFRKTHFSPASEDLRII
ncbi:hypothetical protein LEP1GSC103_3569 [Leptospira borgpetersenii serovar Javanica str. UI 09931]|uniref:Uncharacterized protein n=3 Tax=Leptospira borgpetersenii TaxID=174 RepID=A0A0S2IQ25_LEPBO|nr:hypothetical protein LBBP_01088 [Leptospira borgpetersenii serovar Ballum]EKP12465.1 hypothetical protein LEP1GSC128_0643 [Leptospira borgpetersenii str. 200801926]EKQ98207.1 hypothetical protein LEP1GSC121_3195 [Leptospira borgpetersenii serovar Castellonis str. 200801910]ENO63858.1 hypothetical protein LEP1GSC191_0243 [Leptospira borgpetersenii serovar Mini str. 201000851]EPG59424.1 hypothetical protein LEP1GSC103_3569 [Leptospira borgpetersenii serovar Javanica str. UI 09931]